MFVGVGFCICNRAGLKDPFQFMSLPKFEGPVVLVSGLSVQACSLLIPLSFRHVILCWNVMGV